MMGGVGGRVKVVVGFGWIGVGGRSDLYMVGGLVSVGFCWYLSVDVLLLVSLGRNGDWLLFPPSPLFLSSCPRLRRLIS